MSASVRRSRHARLTGPKEFVAIPGGDHNDVTPPGASAYWAAVDRFIARLGNARAANR
jgi:hypothetical protein